MNKLDDDVHKSVELSCNVDDNYKSNENQIINCDTNFGFMMSQYPSFRKFGILFIKIGNTYCFAFDFNQEPKYCIGGEFMKGFAMCLFFILISIAFVVLLCFANPLLLFPYLGLVTFAFASFLAAYLLNPGLILRSTVAKDDDSLRYCDVCKIYVPKDCRNHHCHKCNICISGFDHHCGVIGKCVGKNNKKWFFAMVFSSSLLYCVTIFGVIFYFIFTLLNIKASKQK